MHGISQIIEIILIILIIVSIVFLLWLFSSNLFNLATTSTTSTAENVIKQLLSNIEISSVSGSVIYVKNIGQTNLTEFLVLFDGSNIKYNISKSFLEPNEIGKIIIRFPCVVSGKLLIATKEGAFVTKNMDSDISLCMTFDDGTATDNSGNGNNGIILGSPNTVTGVYGNALDFDGISDYINITNSQSLNLQEFTYEAWIRPRSTFTNYGSTLFMKEDSGGGNLLIFRAWTGNRIVGNIPSGLTYDYKNISNNEVTNVIPYTILENGWYHVFWVTTETEGKVYLNGTLVFETPKNMISYTNPRSLFIGQDQDGSSQSELFNGTIDEVRIYSRALSLDEILLD